MIDVEIEASASENLKDGAPCIHCLIMGFLESYWTTFGVGNEETGQVAFDVVLTVAKLAEVMANLIVRVDSPAAQEKLIADVHAVFDGILKAMQTGEPVEINIGGPGKIH